MKNEMEAYMIQEVGCWAGYRIPVRNDALSVMLVRDYVRLPGYTRGPKP